MILDRKTVAHGSIPVGKVMSLESTFKSTAYNTTPPIPGLEWGTLAAGTDGYVLTCSAAAAEGVAWAAPATNGTVTSISFTGDGTVLSSAASTAVTASGTVTAALATQAANLILAGPTSGATAVAPTFRALVTADLPAVIAATTITIGSNHMTWGAAAPSTGTWAVGDVCWNTSAAAGASPGWVNTSASGSGTWKTMPNIQA